MARTLTISRTLSNVEQVLLALLAFVLFWTGVGVMLWLAARVVRVGW